MSAVVLLVLIWFVFYPLHLVPHCVSGRSYDFRVHAFSLKLHVARLLWVTLYMRAACLPGSEQELHDHSSSPDFEIPNAYPSSSMMLTNSFFVIESLVWA
jgi:hypothetical protein